MVSLSYSYENWKNMKFFRENYLLSVIVDDRTGKHSNFQTESVLCRWGEGSALDKLKHKSTIAEIENSQIYRDLIRFCEKYNLKYKTEIQRHSHPDYKFGYYAYAVSVSYDSTMLSEEQKEADNLRLWQNMEQDNERIIQKYMREIQNLEEKWAGPLENLANAILEIAEKSGTGRFISMKLLQNDALTEIKQQIFFLSIVESGVGFQDFTHQVINGIVLCPEHTLISFSKIGMSDLPEEKMGPLTCALSRKLHDKLLKYYGSIDAKADILFHIHGVTYLSDPTAIDVNVYVRNPFYRSLQNW